MIFRQRVNAFPMEQVCTFEQEHLTALSGHIVCNQGAEGTIGSLPDLGVTEGKTASAFGKFLPGDNGVVFVFGIVNAVAESYPNLKADEMYLKTMNSVESYEENVRLSRMTFNDTVTRYNNVVRMFPSSVVASILSFPIRDYLTEDTKKTDYPDALK